MTTSTSTTTRTWRSRPRSAVSEDDPAARKVVGRELHPHAVAGQDPDAVAPHLPGRVPEGLVAVVELDPEHAAAERLDDLALELDLLFLVGYLPTPFSRTPCAPLGRTAVSSTKRLAGDRGHGGCLGALL